MHSNCKDDLVQAEKLQGLFGQFSSFLDICALDPSKAVDILAATDLKSSEVQDIIARYSKEARRLVIDIKHEAERKTLMIRQRLESELVDIQPIGVESLKASIEPQDSTILPEHGLDLTKLITFGNSSDLSIENQVININNPQIISTAKCIIAQEIKGDITYNENDEALIKLFKRFSSSTELTQLQSSLDELKDDTVLEEQRLLSWQKLQRFITKVGPAIGQTGLNVLGKYLEHLLIK